MNQLRESSPLQQMIQQQIIERGITDPAVLAAMRQVPRDKFFPSDRRGAAFADQASSIGHGQTISQPYMVALMTQRIQLDSTCRVLEIGTGSGYQTAILARLAGEVYSIERVKPLLDEAWERLIDLGCRNVHFKHADGTLGWSEFAPFDRILITAGAPRLPERLLREQLKDGGIAVLPVGPQNEQTLLEVRRAGDAFKTTEICACRFVKLLGAGGWDAADEPVSDEPR